MNKETIKAAREALDNLDDYALMNTGVNAIGPRAVLESFISEVERTTSPVSQMTDEQIEEAAWLHIDPQHKLDWAMPENQGATSVQRAYFRAGMKAGLAAAAPQAQAVEPAADPRPLFDRKLADLQQRGYEVIGRILHKDGQYALFDSSCRWLTQPQYWRLMHEQDGSLFAAPASQQAAEPVAWVPVHPVNGPLWANTVENLESDRPANYPVRALFFKHPPFEVGAHLAIQQPQDERAAFEAWYTKGGGKSLVRNFHAEVAAAAEAAWQARAALAKKGDAA